MNHKFSIFFNFFIRHNKIRAFAVFFFISALLWIMMQLSKTYHYNLKVPVLYQNLPSQYYKGFLPKDTLSITLKLSGFKILHYKISKPVLKINVQKDKLIHQRVWKTDKHFSDIQALFDENVHIISISPEKLNIQIKSVHKKKVPVYPDVKISFKAGFKNKEKAKWQPDSLWIFGQPGAIDTINKIYTKVYEFKKIAHTIDKKLKLKELEGIKYNTNQIRYHLPVSEIIEDTISLPLTIINKPASVKVFLFPKKIKLKFKVFKEQYKQLKPNDFMVIVRYQPELKNWKPELLKYPDGIFDIRFKPDKISYLIKS